MNRLVSPQPIDQHVFLTLIGQKKIVHVKIGEVAFAEAPDVVLASYGLGSCVAICLFMPKLKVGALMHALLPHPPSALQDADNPYKYVRLGIDALVNDFKVRGISPRWLVAFIAGGANMLKSASLDIPAMRVGERNVEMAHEVLSEMQIPIIAKDVGGQRGRSVVFDPSDGIVYVKTLEETRMHRLM